MLLHPLLPFGDELREFGFLLSGQNLVSLRSDLRVQHLDLRVNLRFLICNALRLSLIKCAALDELHHLLAARVFLRE